jgi:hypothetical protein
LALSSCRGGSLTKRHIWQLLGSVSI